MSELVNKLSESEAEERKPYFILCSKDIKKAHETGGYSEQTIKSFPKVGPKDGPRIDLEVRVFQANGY